MSESVITLTDIHKSYGKHEVLKGVDMTVNKGDIYGLVGTVPVRLHFLR